VNGEILTQTDLEERQITALQDRNRKSRTRRICGTTRARALLVEITPGILQAPSTN
jgi:hypothetical protein